MKNHESNIFQSSLHGGYFKSKYFLIIPSCTLINWHEFVIIEI